jgi:glycosyltransferase involved in cell wall biosynthesis
MKLLHCIRSADPQTGGPIEGVRQFTRILTERGHQVEIVTLDAPTAPWLKDLPVRAHGCGPVSSSYGYKSGFIDWLEEKSKSKDAVIGNGIWQYNSFATRVACRRSDTPYFVFLHGMLDPWFKRTYPFKHLKKWLYWPWGEYRVLRDARAVLFTCEEERRLARESFWLYKAREMVLGYGSCFPEGDSVEQIRIFDRKYPDLESRRILLFLGRIHPKKGLDLLLKAFARVAHRDSTLHLVIAGPDQIGWRTQLEKLSIELHIDNRVAWLGMLKGDLKWGAIRSAEAFILPSHQENFGIVVAEAMSCGVPVLISNQVNIWREIQMDRAGFVEPDDLQGTIRLLETWLNLDEIQRQDISRNALHCFKERFEMTSIAERMIAFFEKEIGTRH